MKTLVVVEAPTGQARPVELLEVSDAPGYNYIELLSPNVVRRPGLPDATLALTGTIRLVFGTPGAGELEILPNARNVIAVWKSAEGGEDAAVAPIFHLPAPVVLDQLGTQVEFHSVFVEDIEQGGQGDGLLFQVNTAFSLFGVTKQSRVTFFVVAPTDELSEGWSNTSGDNGLMLSDGGNVDKSTNFDIAYGTHNESNVGANFSLLTGLRTKADISPTADNVVGTLIGALGTSTIRPPIGAEFTATNRSTANHLKIAGSLATATIIGVGLIPGTCTFHWDGAQWLLDETNGTAA